MKKSIAIFLFIFTIVVFSAPLKAQKCTLSSKPSSDSIMLAAISDVIFIVKQEYGLKSTNPKNNTIYSPLKSNLTDVVYGVGSTSMNKLYVESYIIKPWLTDKNYLKLKKDTLIPALGKTYFRKFNSKSYEPIMCSVIADSLIVPDTSRYANKNLSYFQLEMSSDKNSPIGNSIYRNNNANDSTGIIVIFYVPKNTEFPKNPESDFKVEIRNAIVHFDSKTQLAIIDNIQVNGTVIGGGFFSVNALNGGISFDLKGLLCFSNSKWAISNLPPQYILKKKKNASSTDPGSDPKRNQLNLENQNNSNSTEPKNNK